MKKDKKDFIKERYIKRYQNNTFNKNLDNYEEIQAFAPNGNIFDTQDINEETHFIMRMAVQFHLLEAFQAMKMDMTDDNVMEDFETGNISTPGRIAKVMCGDGIHDDRELGSGRWAVKPRLASFPNTGNKTIPITKRVDIISNCSHHNIVFSTLQREDSYAVISYIPDENVLGISKLQRITDWVSQRYWLQEDLTKKLYDEVKLVAKTDSVLVAIINAVHGCESFRGAKANDGSFTSMYYGGAFEDIDVRNGVLNNT